MLAIARDSTRLLTLHTDVDCKVEWECFKWQEEGMRKLQVHSQWRVLAWEAGSGLEHPEGILCDWHQEQVWFSLIDPELEVGTSLVRLPVPDRAVV